MAKSFNAVSLLLLALSNLDFLLQCATFSLQPCYPLLHLNFLCQCFCPCPLSLQPTVADVLNRFWCWFTMLCNSGQNGNRSWIRSWSRCFNINWFILDIYLLLDSVAIFDLNGFFLGFWRKLGAGNKFLLFLGLFVILIDKRDDFSIPAFIPPYDFSSLVCLFRFLNES